MPRRGMEASALSTVRSTDGNRRQEVLVARPMRARDHAFS
jgi:hypothetical protein